MGTNGMASPPLPQVSPQQVSPRLSSTQRLSPVQRSYREDPDGFMERLDARAERLFEDGYTVAPVTEAVYVFRMATPPDGRGLVCRYDVNPQAQTCTCPFYTRQATKGEYLTDNGEVITCKHLRGLAALVRAMLRKRHAKEEDPRAGCLLWQHWMVYRAQQRRERYAREKQEQTTERTTS